MRIAIPASGPCVDDLVDTRFERALYYILFNLETGETMFLPNPYVTKNGGVSPCLVKLLVQNNVTHVITHRMSENVRNTLVEAGILIIPWKGSGTVSSALEQFRAGRICSSVSYNSIPG